MWQFLCTIKKFVLLATFPFAIIVFEVITFSFPRTFPSEPLALLLADLYYTRLALGGYCEHVSLGNLMALFSKLQSNISTCVPKVTLFPSDFSVNAFSFLFHK